MTDGEELYHLFGLCAAAVGWSAVMWPAMLPIEQRVWEDTAEAFRQKIEKDAPFVNLQSATHHFAAQAHDYKALLKRYGHHDPSCPIGGVCSCGFAEVERELVA